MAEGQVRAVERVAKCFNGSGCERYRFLRMFVLVLAG